MTKAEVIKTIGEENWNDFLRWMSGQTYGSYPNGQANYYDCDVEAFVYKLKHKYDRQQDPLAWD